MDADPPRIGFEVVGLAGYRQGSRQPCLALRVAAQGAVTAARLEPVVQQLCDGLLPAPPSAAPALPAGEQEPTGLLLARVTGEVLTRLQRTAGLPVVQAALPAAASLDGRQALLLLPCQQRAQALVVQTLDALYCALDAALHGQTQPWAALAQDWAKRLRPAAYADANSLPFLMAAHALGIPVVELPGELLQFGWGRRSAWLDGSFTGETSAVGARIARDKHSANALLRQHGLPVPEHRLVETPEAALAAAAALGYPVVVKPVNLDGGVGVAADLRDPHELRLAFARARAHAGEVLIERHHAGRDYRLTVFRGEVLWVIERVPGGVTGDGRHSVRELVAAVNADPRRGSGPAAALRPLSLDVEVLALLAREGLGPDDVPAAGRWVRLRRTANVAMGGMPVPAMHEAHADNLALASRAAAALRLDLAGVDLLTPDIGRSWRETGAVICEVNAQPHIGLLTAGHVHGQILGRMLPDGGRIGVAVLVTARSRDALARRIAAELDGLQIPAGWHDAEGIGRAEVCLVHGDLDPYAAGQALLLDRALDAAVVTVRDARALRTGLPFDRYDVLLLAPGSPEDPERIADAILDDLLRLLLPACAGKVLASVAATESLQHLVPLCRAAWVFLPQDDDALVRSATHALSGGPATGTHNAGTASLRS